MPGKKTKKAVKKTAKKTVKRTVKKAAPKKSAKKTVKKVVKKPAKARRSKPVDESFFVGFEEVKQQCPSCGKEYTIVKSSGFSAEGMLCPRCTAGGVTDFGDDD